MKKFRVCFKALSLCLAILLGLTAGAQADSFTVYEGASLTDVSQFGNLNQHNPIIQAAYGNYGCQVTAYANALVYLQKAYPSVYGTSLVSGYSPDTLATTAVTLGGADYMNVQVTRDIDGNITGAFSRFRDQVWGVYNYIQAQAPDHTVYSAQMIPIPNMVNNMPPGGWTQTRYQPGWVSMNFAYPTEAFLYNALSNSQALVIHWNQADPVTGQIIWPGKTHLLTVTGLTWDSDNNSGTIYFIDPKGGTQRNSPFWQDPANGVLWLDYGETNGVPWTRQDGSPWWFSGDVRITLALAEGPAVPLPSTLLLLGSGLLGLAGVGRKLRKS
jgi:hypothetical protein